MNYKIMQSLEQYEELLRIEDVEKRNDYFRYTMMKPFHQMWSFLNVPIKAKEVNGYDVLMATSMLGYVDITDDKQIREGLKVLRENDVYTLAENTLNTCFVRAENAGLKVNAEELTFGFYLADSIKLNHANGYAGFGGIPGYITVNISPNPYNVPRIPAVIAHEVHHNIRFSYFEWNHGDITVGDYIVIEGLAESFAQELYGKELLGPWVTSMDQDDLAYSIHVIGEALDVKGFAEVSSYMYGDDFARQEGYQPVGLSFCAGYAVGYEVVQSFLKNKNISIYEATLLSSEEIIEGSSLFSR